MVGGFFLVELDANEDLGGSNFVSAFFLAMIQE